MNAQLELYPYKPGYKKRQTSKAAAAIINKHVTKLQKLVIATLASQDLTADEIAIRLGVDRLAIRPRCAELAKMNLIEDSGVRRKNRSGINAIVWRVK